MEKCTPKDQLGQVELIVPLHERYLTIPRLALGDVFDKAGLDICDIAGYKVALTEACRNLIYFSYRHLEPPRLRVAFSTGPDRIIVLCIVEGECFCEERVKTHPALHRQEAVQDLDLLVVSSLVDHLRTGLRLLKGHCLAFVELTKFLQEPHQSTKEP
ncbi:MAG: hypothetical protein GX998_03460 [Firmicutes bacterium]|nr:hypothetical protein [Bacillota bacterium]